MTRRSKTRLNAAIAFVAIPLMVFVAASMLRARGTLFRLEAIAYDAMIRTLASPEPKSSPVVVIGVSSEDIRAWGQYPISDRKLDTLLKRILQADPSAVGIDIYRDFASADKADLSSARADHDALVATILEKPDQILVVKRIPTDRNDREYVLAPAKLEKESPQQIAVASFAPDDDSGIRRAVPLYEDLSTEKGIIPEGTPGVIRENLGWALASLYLFRHHDLIRGEGPDGTIELQPPPLADGTPAPATVHVGRMTFPLGFYQGGRWLDPGEGRQLQFMLDYRAPRDLVTYTVEDVLRNDFDINRLKDKVILIGVTAKGVKDHVVTPHGANTFGFFAHGYLADQVIRWAETGQAPPTFLSNAKSLAFTALWCLFGAITGGIGKLRSVWRMSIFFVVEIALLTGLAYFLLRNSTIVPFIPPLIGLLTSGGLALAYISAVDRKDQQLVQQLMAMHISRPVAEQLLENRDAFFEKGKLTPQRTVATVLFSDLMDFTPIAERLESTDLMNWLNEFFEEMTSAVEQCDGVVNKFNGDMVMALFGPPRIREKDDEIASDARNAVRCAVLMRRSLAKMNQRWLAEGLPTPRMRIGIYTGPLVAGSLGGKNRIEYTVIGDTVNTASRLESSNKECMDDAIDGTRIIIGDTTCLALGQSYSTRSLGDWGVKGKSGGVKVHAVLGDPDSASPPADELSRKSASLPLADSTMKSHY